jgi:hypothetical protein
MYYSTTIINLQLLKLLSVTIECFIPFKNTNFNALENSITKPFDGSIKIHILNGINSFISNRSYLSCLISIM